MKVLILNRQQPIHINSVWSGILIIVFNGLAGVLRLVLRTGRGTGRAKGQAFRD
jgi:hypothetical protein